ncbi:hypothetical protein ACEN9F_30525 [Duganella sp. CT11-25]|uniref:hypothetical protein n=1 Tax=unclassified Duganella TaxID=2636909 RepID=UPI0039AFDED9
MKRPSFQFYPADWRNNSKLRRCSEAARGAWVDVMCVLHDSDEYGVCRWPLDEVARAAGVPLKLVRELVSKDVLKGADKGAADYIYTPRHAGKTGAPVTLVVAGDGSCWYCSRFVRDEYIRQRRGQGTRFSEDNQPPKEAPNHTPKPPIGTRHGDGPTSTSTSTKELPTPSGVGPSAAPKSARKKAKTPLPEDFAISDAVRSWAATKGHENLQAHFDSFVGKVRANGYVYVDWDQALQNAIRDDWAKLSQRQLPLTGAAGPPTRPSRHSGFENIDYSEGIENGRIT